MNGFLSGAGQTSAIYIWRRTKEHHARHTVFAISHISLSTKTVKINMTDWEAYKTAPYAFLRLARISETIRGRRIQTRRVGGPMLKTGASLTMEIDQMAPMKRRYSFIRCTCIVPNHRLIWWLGKHDSIS